MGEEIDKNPFTIAAYTEGNPPIGVNLTRPAGQFVYVNAPAHNWTARKVGKNTYHLSVDGYRYVGVANGKVFASIYPEGEKLWKITYHPFQKGYTIELADKPGYGWTIPSEGEERPVIAIGHIIVGISEPPRFLTGQLFLLKQDE